MKKNNWFPKVSIIMPVYNAGLFLKNAIDSILMQTFKDFELIILNDGSTDNSEDIILSYRDKRIVYIKNENNLKLIKTLNKGIDAAKGEYIARMDADDISFPYRLEKQISLLEKNNFDVVGSSFIKIDENNKIIGNHLGFRASENEIKFLCLIGNPIPHPTIVAKADLLKKFRYNDSPDFVHIEDYELWCRMLREDCKFYQSDEPLLFYRRTNDNITVKYHSELIEHFMNVCHSFQKDIMNYNMDEESLCILFGKSQGVDYPIQKVESVFKYFKKMYDSFYLDKAAKDNVGRWLNYKRIKLILVSKMSYLQKLYLLLKNIFPCVWLISFSIGNWLSHFRFKEILKDLNDINNDNLKYYGKNENVSFPGLEM